MTELFQKDGHLSDAGLRALVAGELDELGRLEAAEHLSFCDGCLVRYTALLEGAALEEPPADQTLPVMRRARARAARALASRWASAAAALIITGALWYTGVFADVASVFTVESDALTPPAPAAPAREETASGAILRAVSDWSEKVQEAMRPAWQAPQTKDTAGRGKADAPAPQTAGDADPALTQTKGVD